METKKLLTQNQLAAVLNVCTETVSRLTVNKRIPFICVGRRGKRYDIDAVIAALSTPTTTNEAMRNNISKKLS
jgi:excisionase family DNA binding protein